MTETASLTPRQTGILIAFGAIGWFAAALLIRFLEPFNVFDGPARFLTYLLIIPGSVPLVWIGQAIARHTKVQRGLAVAWIPWLCGSTTEHVLAGAAAILWGAGVAIALGFIMGRR